MTYMHNNAKIKKEQEVRNIKKSMHQKLKLVEDQLRSTKFEQLAGGVRESVADPMLMKVEVKDSDYSLDSQDAIAPSAPFLRKGISTYDPEVVKKEEKELEKKRQAIENTEKNMDIFRDFNESEKKELDKLDTLTKIFLFLRRHITNPIIS